MKKKVIRVILISFGIITLISLVYLMTGIYEASSKAQEVFKENGGVSENGYYKFEANSSDVGLILYQGAKVESESYSYLSNLEDTNLFISDFAFDFAFFNPNLAEKIIADNPQIKKWYIAGHSLGGVFAYDYASKNDLIEGVIMLGSYPLSNEAIDFKVLSIFGTRDGLIQNYEEEMLKYPSTATFELVEGANHSGYGDYGFQKNDLKAEITADEQHEIIINLIDNFIKGN